MNKQRLCIVAVDVRSAHNIGSLFRTCDGFGAELIIVGASPRPRYDDDVRLPHVIRKAEKAIQKTALGAEASVSWRYANTLLECRHLLQKEEFRLCALEQSDDSQPLTQLELQGNTALIVGREVEGLSLVELSLCDEIYEIPMQGLKESFNVSVAAGIGLYQAAIVRDHM